MKKFLLIILFLILFLPAYRFLLKPGYFSMHDDLQVMRVFQMEKCLSDGQIPCRWAPDMAWGYGQAMFNFYSATPYYLGALIRVVFPVSILFTVKTLFWISLVGSGLGMYFLARQFWGRSGALLSATLYVYAPYHALDIYVRGALSESFALMILPFLWLYIYKIIKFEGYRNNILGIIWLAALLATHNISTMLYAPFTILWALFWLWQTKNYKSIRSLIFIGVFGLGLASFFILPALVEKSLIKADLFTLDYFDYQGHFVSLRQLFLDREWGYGASTFGDQDDLSFQIGVLHWIIAGVAGLLALTRLKSKSSQFSILSILLLSFAAITTFLTHGRSYFIWEAIPLLPFTQFPWRFLGLSMFFTSFAGGFVTKSKLLKIFTPVFILLIIIFNFGYFRAEHYFATETDQTKLSGELFEIQSAAARLDYLPKTAMKTPEHKALERPQVVKGEADVAQIDKRSNFFFFDTQVFSQSAKVEIPVIYFPGWEVVVGGRPYPAEPGGVYGLITINLENGTHMVEGRFTNTPVRDIANALTVISFMALIFYAAKNSK